MKDNSPFSPDYFLGYINQVTPYFIKVHFPSSTLMKTYFHEGIELSGGTIGNYVVIEGHSFGFLGKIIDIELPEKERMELNESSFNTNDFHPTGRIEILLAFDLFNPDKVNKGLNKLPNIGSKVYICRPDFISKYFKSFGVKEEKKNPPLLDLGKLTYDNTTPVTVSQQAIFGRHCAVVGTTGGGKSFTVSKLIESVYNNGSKCLVIDSTGEYNTLIKENDKFISNAIGEDSFLHYSNLSVEDIFTLLRPGGQVQAPKLLEAIKSLKIVDILGKVYETDNTVEKQDDGFLISVNETDKYLIKVKDGNLIKAGGSIKPYDFIYYKYIEQIEGLFADFNLTKLPRQIYHECIREFDYNDKNKWGIKYEQHLNNCMSLILRANNLIQSPSFKSLFGIEEGSDSDNELTNSINAFLKSDNCVFRINFESVSFDFQAREILANAIGKYLLQKARRKDFMQSPLILFIDEAHQYLNKKVKDEYFETTKLDAFDLIAKECRKYGLFLCLATQMPRDIPVGTLSQIGTFIVHRLINPYDKESIENACSSANKNALSFLPILGAGEAVMMGVDFPMPVMLKVNLPKVKPDSGTPQFNIEETEFEKESVV